MKKSIIAAGAASVALAAMPVVGVFAADVTTQTDTLTITIDKVCSFGHQDPETVEEGQDRVIDVTGVAHTDGAGAWTTNTLSKTMSNGTTTNDLGSTTLGVYCNNVNGYTITTSGAGALTSSTSDTIPVNDNFSASSTGWSYKVAAAAGSNNRGVVAGTHVNWAASANANEVIAQSPSSAPKMTTNQGDFFTVTYGVGINDSLSAGTYTGTITYTLAQVN